MLCSVIVRDCDPDRRKNQVTAQLDLLPDSFLTDRFRIRILPRVPRPKAFDPRRALDSALHCFKQHGFNGASLSNLTQEMGVGRASLYATYGDKRALFMRALADYADATFGFFRQPARHRDRIRSRRFARSSTTSRRSPFATTVASVASSSTPQPSWPRPTRKSAPSSRGASSEWKTGFASALERARAEGRLAADKDPVALGRFLFATIVGIRVIGKTRADLTVLKDIVDSALACLERP